MQIFDIAGESDLANSSRVTSIAPTSLSSRENPDIITSMHLTVMTAAGSRSRKTSLNASTMLELNAAPVSGSIQNCARYPVRALKNQSYSSGELYDAMSRSKPGNKREIVMRAKVLLDREFQELDPDPGRLLRVARKVLSQAPSCEN
jgi:hypothetical protein